MGNITAEQRAKQRAEPTMSVGFRAGNYKVPAIQNEINSNLAIHASDRPERMKTCKSELQFLITDITNAADRHYRESGDNPLTIRGNTDKTVQYAITRLFNNKTFAAEFVRDPMGTSEKVVAAVKKSGMDGIAAILKNNQYQERGRFLSGVPIKRM